MNKKLILIIIFLLFTINVLAQDFNIQVIHYNQETQKARIQIANTASTTFHDLKMQIDESAEILLTPNIEPGSIFSTFFILPRGEHTITLTTKEGTIITKKLYLSPTEEQIDQQIKKSIEQEKTEFLELEQQPSKLKYIYIILALIAILIIYWIYKKFSPPKL